jgi:hypothetical protein
MPDKNCPEDGALFILQKAFERQTESMRLGKFITFGIAVSMLGLAAQPASAQVKDRNKRPDAQTEATDACKPAIRSMSESTPQRKNDCQKARRILM